jgi:ATP-dependent Clp protease ATP-binding subunit ClpC
VRRTLRIHLVGDGAGLWTGRLVARADTFHEVTASAHSDDEVLSRIRARLEELIESDPDVLEPFLWSEELSIASVRVEVRPQAMLGKRSVIGKGKIPLELSYLFAALSGGEGYRVLLPRFGWSFVLEELAMAPEVLRQAVSSALGGASPRSVFEFREAAVERVLDYSPKLGKKRREPDALFERFETLRQIAEDWSALGRAGKLGAHFGPVDADRYSELCAAERKPSLLVVGPSGVGKTAWVKELARRLGSAAAGNREDRARLWATSADRIMAGMKYLGMWEARCLEIVAELSGEGHWLYVDRLAALARPQSGASSIADLLLPAAAAGEISLIAEATEQELARLVVEAPGLVSAFNVVRLEPPAPEQVVELLFDVHARRFPGARLHPDAARRLVRHLSLYRKDHAFPGKALLFLAWLERETAPKALLPADADRLFCRWSGLPEALVSDQQRGDAETIGAALMTRVIGQDDACRRSAELLARFKAGVNDPERPIGSLLFVGPTGVGKTELAKQLARFVFGSDDRLVRLDMSEFLFPGSTLRLISDERGSESLAQRVSRQPLSLVLLDEIEKAHPAVFDLLLALLGEGRLTTSGGRLVDFRMTLVVMTSNLGTGEARAGFGRGQAEPDLALAAVRRHFRPEFVNRLDQVIAFGELSPSALRSIVELLLASAGEREGLRKRRIRLQASDEAKARLAELGFDPKYGARPLKRVIEEQVMTPIAIELARRPKLGDCRALVTSEGGAIRVELAAGP